MKFILISMGAIFLISGCSAPKMMPSRVVQQVGQGRYYLEDVTTSKALARASAECSGMGKKLETINIVPHQMEEDAAVTFMCH